LEVQNRKDELREVGKKYAEKVIDADRAGEINAINEGCLGNDSNAQGPKTLWILGTGDGTDTHPKESERGEKSHRIPSEGL